MTAKKSKNNNRSYDEKLLLYYLRISLVALALIHLGLFIIMYFGGLTKLSFYNVISITVYLLCIFGWKGIFDYLKILYYVIVLEVVAFVLVNTYCIKGSCLFPLFALALVPVTSLFTYVMKAFDIEDNIKYVYPVSILTITFIVSMLFEVGVFKTGFFEAPDLTRKILQIYCLSIAFLTCLITNWICSTLSVNHVVESNFRFSTLSKKLVLAMVRAVEAKDIYTKGHSERVSKYAVMIGKEYGLSDAELNQLMYCGILHDIGKIGISDAIINKQGKLTDEEYNEIKQHPLIGSNVLKDIDEIPQLSIGARWHHERYDGKGYPDGLAGQEIPLFARIISVADAYDAMTSNRNYRGYLSQEKVRQELVDGSGTQFDPELAVIMIKFVDQDKHYKLHE